MSASSKTRDSIRAAVSQQAGKSRSKQKWLSRVAVAGTCIVLLILIGAWWGGEFSQPEVVAELHSMVDEEVARLAKSGKKKIAVIAPAFSSDCVETLEEINEEIKESFEEAGGEEFTYIPCLNDDAAHIKMMTSIVKNELGGWI